MLTEQQIFAYVDKVEEGNGTFCPYCNSDQIEGGSVTVEGNHAYQEIRCNSCDKVWDDMYRLVSIQERFDDEE